MADTSDTTSPELCTCWGKSLPAARVEALGKTLAHSLLAHPRDRRRRAFDVVTVIFVLYLAWKIPFSAGIGWFVNPPGLKTFEYFLDVWFVVDICLNFRTGFVHDGRVFGAVFCIISSFLHCSYFIF